MTKLHEIHISKKDRKITARDGKSLMEAFVEASIFLRTDCGGRGTCGKCRVNKINDIGKSESITSCNCKVTENLKIEIPEESLLSSHSSGKAPISFPPSFVNRKKQQSREKTYGIAVDLGTTTIAVYLCDRFKREVLRSMAFKNPQCLYGADVMSRIGAIGESKSVLRRLQKIAVNAIEWAIHEMLILQSLKKEDISQIVAVGNPTMIHILSGVNPQPIGLSPYQPVFREARIIYASKVGLTFGDIPLCTLPHVSGFIGGDILSAALAADIYNQPKGTLLVDLGTNGEILFKAEDGLYATSCATGPAFEGASLSCGMLAIPGAINKVTIEDKHDYPNCSIISSFNKIPPLGICGTGIISAVAELCRKKIIEPGGAFIADNRVKPLQRSADNKIQYQLGKANGTTGVAPVFISQKDIRSVQLGKAALQTGIDFLIKAAGYSQPEKIIIAGTFGSHIDKADMLRIGMLPEINLNRIEISGNLAGAGAIMLLCEDDYFNQSIEIAQEIKTIELATSIEFQGVFVNNLRFSC